MLICKKIWQTILPNICAICKVRSDTTIDLCSVCHQELPWLTNSCYQCGRPLANFYESIRCQECISFPPNFDRFCALFAYRPPINNLITQLKFKAKLAYGNLLGQLLLQQLACWYKDTPIPEAIIPVPLYKSRYKTRGFNQVHEILKPSVQVKRITVIDDLCIKVKPTKPQTQMKAKYRRRNLQGVFALSKKVSYEHIAIVDDVFTTGSTVRAISKIFKAKGVQYIDIWCICRA